MRERDIVGAPATGSYLLRAAAFCLGFANGGCLLAPPPDLEDPVQTRPFVYSLRVEPPVSDPIRIEIPSNMGEPEPSEVNLVIPFHSEDLGEDVRAELHLYDGGGHVGRLTGTRLDPGSLDTLRRAEITWYPRRHAFGCYRLMAIVAHESSFNSVITDGFVKPTRQDDSEIVTWLVNIYDKQQGDATPLADCPRVGAVD